jgi:hypothetical protein
MYHLATLLSTCIPTFVGTYICMYTERAKKLVQHFLYFVWRSKWTWHMQVFCTRTTRKGIVCEQQKVLLLLCKSDETIFGKTFRKFWEKLESIFYFGLPSPQKSQLRCQIIKFFR